MIRDQLPRGDGRRGEDIPETVGRLPRERDRPFASRERLGRIALGEGRKINKTRNGKPCASNGQPSVALATERRSAVFVGGKGFTRSRQVHGCPAK
jgi:hypothetical protein